MKTLNKDSLEVVKVYDESTVRRVRQMLLTEVSLYDEYCECPLGGGRFDPNIHISSVNYGMLGCASSFHSTTVRNIRMDQWQHGYYLMNKYFQACNFELLPDRLMVRPATQTIARGSWHRDTSFHACNGDVIFGGWINFDFFDQPFTYVPNSSISSTNARPDERGYTVVDNVVASECNSLKETVKVPPGHMLVFNETLIHRIMPTNTKQIKTGFSSVRLFQGFRLTTSNDLLNPSKMEELIGQDVLTLKDGKKPSAYGQRHWCSSFDRILDVSWFSNDIVLENRKRTNVLYGTVPREYKSLSSYGFDLFWPVTPTEKKHYEMYPLGKQYLAFEYLI